MRYLRYLSVTTALVLVLAGCKKGGDGAPEETGDGSLTGNWEAYQSYGGMSPLTTYPPGNGNRLTFDGTNYKIYVNGVVAQQGTYELRTDSVVNVQTCALQPAASQAPNRIVYDGNLNGGKQFFELSGNTLKIMSGCIPLDGGWAIYKKRSSSQ